MIIRISEKQENWNWCSKKQLFIAIEPVYQLWWSLAFDPVLNWIKIQLMIQLALLCFFVTIVFLLSTEITYCSPEISSFLQLSPPPLNWEIICCRELVCCRHGKWPYKMNSSLEFWLPHWSVGSSNQTTRDLRRKQHPSFPPDWLWSSCPSLKY